MKKALIGIFITVPFFSYAVENRCAIVGSWMEQSLFDAVTHDLNIDAAVIQRHKMKVNVMDISPVSEVLARQLARTDSNADKQRNGEALLPEGDYFESYYTNGAKNITARYIFVNNKGQSDTFIASSIINNDECSVRFNGYLILSRQF
ncbi:Shiga toxin A subunit [Chimaeribacter coloradensis]|uniref:Shiga toxin A subunit n=1 Tax=Chimaeribacter coloradensis TaxID=2060068 RepID=A0A2N5E429_9GAMM|nr:Shiga toxin A subunit [Chimaeribacter coloradensis]PLR35601.1 Shiga toxin A subunit [Chimaeribacter coloradensis]